MNFFKQAFFFMASVMLLTACDNTHSVNTKLFSLDAPAGYLDEPAEESDIVSAVSISSMDGNSAIITIGSLYQDSPESFLTLQIKDNLSTTMPDINIGTPYTATVAGVDALIADCSGETEGERVSGKLYAFNKEPLTFVVLAFGTNGSPDVTEKVIASITPNKEYLDSVLATPKAEIDMLVNLARGNVVTDDPNNIVVADIHADHAARKIIYVMSLPGTAEEYADLSENIAANHQSLLGTLRDGYLDDPALSIPLKHGYSICYEYVPYGTDNVIATETFTPEEIM